MSSISSAPGSVNRSGSTTRRDTRLTNDHGVVADLAAACSAMRSVAASVIARSSAASESSSSRIRARTSAGISVAACGTCSTTDEASSPGRTSNEADSGSVTGATVGESADNDVLGGSCGDVERGVHGVVHARHRRRYPCERRFVGAIEAGCTGRTDPGPAGDRPEPLARARLHEGLVRPARLQPAFGPLRDVVDVVDVVDVRRTPLVRRSTVQALEVDAVGRVVDFPADLTRIDRLGRHAHQPASGRAVRASEIGASASQPVHPSCSLSRSPSPSRPLRIIAEYPSSPSAPTEASPASNSRRAEDKSPRRK